MILDDLGRIVDVKLPVRRIVSLAPVATENLFSIGAGDLLVGVTNICDYPPSVLKLPKVGNFYVPIYEKIRILRPDVVILDSNTITRDAADAVQSRAKTAVYAQKSMTFDDIVRHILQLGDLTAHRPQAERVAQEMRHKADLAAKRVRGKPPVRVFVEISRSPLYGAGANSFIGDLIRRTGGINVVKGDTPYPMLPKEELLVANPQRYIVTYGADINRAKAESFPAPLDKLSAVPDGVRYIPSDLLLRSTPRLADGLLLLATLLHD